MFKHDVQVWVGKYVQLLFGSVNLNLAKIEAKLYFAIAYASGMKVQLSSLPHWHFLSKCRAPTHIKWVYKLTTPLGRALSKNVGGNRRSILTTFHSHVLPCCCHVWIESQFPSRPSWHPEGRNQNAHWPCLMTCYIVPLLQDEDGHSASQLVRTEPSWHRVGASAYTTSPSLFFLILPYWCWAG